VRPLIAIAVTGLLAVVASSTHLSAQQAAADTANVHLRALRMLRDSTERVRHSIAQFRRDLTMAGEQTVVGRARRLTQSCAGLRGAVAQATPLLHLPPSAHEGLVAAHRELLAAMRTTDSVLRTECEQGLGPTGPGQWADSLKAWGPYRTSQIHRSLASIDVGVAGFARAANIKLPPDGR
jgi:hypothetical protein